MACITHFACQCILKRQAVLEKIAETARALNWGEIFEGANKYHIGLEYDDWAKDFYVKDDEKLFQSLQELKELDEKENKNGK